jgi:hypothetical protein
MSNFGVFFTAVGTAHYYGIGEDTSLLKRNFISAVTVYRLFVKTYCVHLRGVAVNLTCSLLLRKVGNYLPVNTA